MKKVSFYTFALVIISFQTFAQDRSKEFEETYFDYVVNSSRVKYLDLDEIKGSPYLINGFVMSKVYFRKDTISEIALRYNIFKQNMEFEHNNSVYNISNPSVIQRIEMDNHVFIYYQNSKEIKLNSYYELLVSGDSYLLAKKEITFKEAKPPKPYGDPEPAKFDIGKYIKKEKISFRKRADLIQLTEFYNSL